MLTGQCMQTYNCIRPHTSLGYRPPASAILLPAEPIPLLALSTAVLSPASICTTAATKSTSSQEETIEKSDNCRTSRNSPKDGDP